MFASKIIRMAAKCHLGAGSRVARFLRTTVPARETKHDVVSELSPTELMSLSEEDCNFLELGQKMYYVSLREQLCKFLELGQKMYYVPKRGFMGPDDPQFTEIEDEIEEFLDNGPIFSKRKPIDLGDSFDQEASGRRIFNATEAFLAKHGKSVKDLTFAIQGCGNVGSWIARLVHKAGGKVVAVSDTTRALKNMEGIDITALLEHMDSEGNSLADFRGGDSMDAVDLLYSECDVLIPGALAGALKRKYAADVKAKFVIDTWDCLIGLFSSRILSKKGVVTLLDIFENTDRTVRYVDCLKAHGFTWGKV